MWRTAVSAFPVASAYADRRLLVQADVEPDADGDGKGDVSQDSADLVLTFRNVHNWAKAGTAEAMFRAFYEALKPDGTLELDERPNLPAGRVQVIMVPLPELPKDDPFWQRMEAMWAAQKARGHVPRQGHVRRVQRHDERRQQVLAGHQRHGGRDTERHHANREPSFHGRVRLWPGRRCPTAGRAGRR